MTLLSIVHSSPHRHTSTIMWLHICKLQAMFLYIFCGYNTSLIQSVIRWQLHDIILYFYGHNLVQNWWVGGTPQGTPPPSGLDGVPPNGTGWGYPPCQDWMGVTPLFRTERGAPSPSLLSHPLSHWETEQKSEHLLCGGRYASCIYAGELSCWGRDLAFFNDADVCCSPVLLFSYQ